MKCVLFVDVDDKLYPRSSESMIQKLGIEETEASQMNGVLYESYGTSMAALKIFSDADQAHVAEVLSSSSFEALMIPLITKTSMLVMKLEFSYTSKSQILDIIEHPCPSNPV
ncbi:hypothetical protein D5086_033359 [Populus alba]|uniref:Uncharacterized protein n=1 Tax=Populus alba TaxID=43335 RepID=A0ACC4AGM7_POPAL